MSEAAGGGGMESADMSGAGALDTSGGQVSPAQTGGESTQAATKEETIRELQDQDLDAYVTMKVNGETKRMTVRDALKAVQKSEAGDKKLHQAAQKERQLQQLIHLFQSDFDKFCEVTGLDGAQFLRANLSRKKEIAEEILAQEYERMQMSPEQRELMEAKQRLQQYEQQEKEAQEKARMSESTQAESREMQKLDVEFADAWKETGLPKNKIFGAWTAAKMLSHQKRTGEPLQAKQAAAIVKEEFLSAVQGIFQEMDAEAIHKILGNEVDEKLRKFNLGRLSAKQGMFQQQQKPSTNQASGQSKKKTYNEHEWRKAFLGS